MTDPVDFIVRFRSLFPSMLAVPPFPRWQLRADRVAKFREPLRSMVRETLRSLKEDSSP